MYDAIVNNTTCFVNKSGKVELYRIVLKSGNTYCRNAPISLIVTGKNIRWYSGINKAKLLASGNTYSPMLSHYKSHRRSTSRKARQYPSR